MNGFPRILRDQRYRVTELIGWGQSIFAPFDGVVVIAEDGYPERPKTFLPSDIAGAYHNAKYFDPQKNDAREVTGNYIVIQKSENVYAALCHLQTGSLKVAVGQTVKQGEYVGNIGHSGNSFAPHLHFQLMDSSDIRIARGLPCAFERYERYQDGAWREVRNGIPTNHDRIRGKNH